jgi:hypothetical protein
VRQELDEQRLSVSIRVVHFPSLPPGIWTTAALLQLAPLLELKGRWDDSVSDTAGKIATALKTTLETSVNLHLFCLNAAQELMPLTPQFGYMTRSSKREEGKGVLQGGKNTLETSEEDANLHSFRVYFSCFTTSFKNMLKTEDHQQQLTLLSQFSTYAVGQTLTVVMVVAEGCKIHSKRVEFSSSSLVSSVVFPQPPAVH